MDMKTLPTRADVLKAIIRDKFNDNQSTFSLAVGKSVAQINQYLNGVRNIGEKVAREIEQKLELPNGYLDTAGAGDPRQISAQGHSNVAYLRQISTYDNLDELPDDTVLIPQIDIKLQQVTGAIIHTLTKKPHYHSLEHGSKRTKSNQKTR